MNQSHFNCLNIIYVFWVTARYWEAFVEDRCRLRACHCGREGDLRDTA